MKAVFQRNRALLPAQLVLIAFALFSLSLFVMVVVQRIDYPFELEWLENESLELVRRLTNKMPIYTPPSAELVQVPYAPLSFAVSAAVGTVTGVDYTLVRAISVVSTMTTLVFLFALVRRETKSSVAGVAAAAVYVASFRVTGAFFDVGKPDSLFIALTVAAVYFARDTKRARNAVVAGVLMALAVLTKQTAIFFFAPIALYLLMTHRRFGLVFAGVAVLGAAVPTLALQLATDGWYGFFVWQLLFEHDVLPGSKIAVLVKDLSSFWPVIILMALAAYRWLRKEHLWSSGFYIAVLGGLVAGAWTGRLHTGGYENVLMPAALAMAIGTGVVLGRVMEAPVKAPVVYGAVALCALQLFFLRYDVDAQVPTKADERAGNALIAQMRQVPGDIFVPRHNTYAVLAGKRAFAGEGGIEDIIRGSDGRAQRLLTESLARHVYEKRFAAIILDGPDDARGLPVDWQKFYQREDVVLPDDTGAMRPVVNRTGSPSQWWVPRPN